MKILIMAAGAVGGYFGSQLHKKNDVVFIARGITLSKIQQKGLTIIDNNLNEETNHVNVTSQVPQGFLADLVLYCVKSYQNNNAINVISSAIASHTKILTLQNGIGSENLLSKSFGFEKIIAGSAYIDVGKECPNIIKEYTGTAKIILDNSNNKSLEITKLFFESKINFTISSNIQSDLWQKLIYISALSGMTCLTRQTFDHVMNDDKTKHLVTQVLSETKSVGEKIGIELPVNIIPEIMSVFEQNSTKLLSSMYQDIMSNKPIELDVINGAVSKLGQQYNVATPINDLITKCLTLHNTNVLTS